MVSITIFAISGGVLILLTATKKLSNNREKQFVVLELISRGDNVVRNLHQHTVHKYAEWRDGAHIHRHKKKAQMHLRNYFNKALNFCKAKIEQYIGNARNSRLLKKKTDGLSEYFKSMSNIEKGNGKIDEHYLDSSQEEESEVK